MNYCRIIIEISVFITYYGTCSVYSVIIAQNLGQVIGHHAGDLLGEREMIAVLLVPLILLSWVPNLKYLAPVSMVANGFMAVGLCITFYYLVTGMPPVSQVPLTAELSTLPLFFSITIFAIEAIGNWTQLLFLSLFSNDFWHFFSSTFEILRCGNATWKQHANTSAFHRYLRCFEQRNVRSYHDIYITWILGIRQIRICYPWKYHHELANGRSVSVKGRSKYRSYITISHIDASINESLCFYCFSAAQVVKVLIALAVYCTFGLQFYVCLEIAWNTCKDRFAKRPLLANYILRTVLVVGAGKRNIYEHYNETEIIKNHSYFLPYICRKLYNGRVIEQKIVMWPLKRLTPSKIETYDNEYRNSIINWFIFSFQYWSLSQCLRYRRSWVWSAPYAFRYWVSWYLCLSRSLFAGTTVSVLEIGSLLKTSW